MSEENFKKTIKSLKPLTLISGFIFLLVNIVLKGLRSRVPLEEELTEKKILLDTADGGQITLRILKAKNSSGLSPCLIYFQGGGFVLVEAPHQRRLTMEYAKRTGAIVIDVYYRLAPKYPYPTAIKDAELAVDWVFDHLNYLKIDPEKIAIAGDSSGATLAALISQNRRDNSLPGFCLQMLIYPVTDHTLKTNSIFKSKNTPYWNSIIIKLMWNLYLHDSPKVEGSKLVPLGANSFSNLPKTYIEICDFDPLRDQGFKFAEALSKAGVPLESHTVNNAPHVFDIIPSSRKARLYTEKRVQALNKAFYS